MRFLPNEARHPATRRTVVQGTLVERDQVEQLKRLDEAEPADLARRRDDDTTPRD